MNAPKKNNLRLTLQTNCDENKIPTAKQFRTWAKAALEQLKARPATITIRIVGITESAELNLRYRHKNSPTNVLSFPCVLPPGITADYLGDLVICAPVVYEESSNQQKDLLAHYAHMTIHGVLHLLGYDHQTDSEAEIMEQLEEKLLKKLGY